eukprot:NODE_691_length_4696_cov_0.623885.p2 type:complete len:298 gc:universal NODE_691_length_4696_cov_0.623885:3250-2357(-)
MKSLFRKKTISERKVEKYDSTQEYFPEPDVIQKKVAEPIFYPNTSLYEFPIPVLNHVFNKQVSHQLLPNTPKYIRNNGKYYLKQQNTRFILHEEDSGFASKELLHSLDTASDSGHVHLMIKDVSIQNAPVKLKLKLVVTSGHFQAETDYKVNDKYKSSDPMGIYVFKINENASISFDIYGKFIPESEMNSAVDKFKNRRVKAQFVDHLRQFSGKSLKSLNFDDEFKIGHFSLDIFTCNLQTIHKSVSVAIGEYLNAALKSKSSANLDHATCEVQIQMSIFQSEPRDKVIFTNLDWIR